MKALWIPSDSDTALANLILQQIVYRADVGMPVRWIFLSRYQWLVPEDRPIRLYDHPVRYTTLLAPGQVLVV